MPWTGQNIVTPTGGTPDSLEAAVLRRRGVSVALTSSRGGGC